MTTYCTKPFVTMKSFCPYSQCSHLDILTIFQILDERTLQNTAVLLRTRFFFRLLSIYKCTVKSLRYIYTKYYVVFQNMITAVLLVVEPHSPPDLSLHKKVVYTVYRKYYVVCKNMITAVLLWQPVIIIDEKQHI